MNERIRDLIEKSGDSSTEWHANTLYDDEIVKFYNLVVKECAKWIKNTDSDPDIGKEDAKALLKHFGVE